MQKDMHYYGVFALARAAGLKKEHAKTIATASQFVDDNVVNDLINFSDAARFHTHATGHHAFNVRNLDLDDQREVWVPFHFLPGNEGTSYTERLICKKNSETARKMVDKYLEMYELPFIVELIGITAHVVMRHAIVYQNASLKSVPLFVENLRCLLEFLDRQDDSHRRLTYASKGGSCGHHLLEASWFEQASDRGQAWGSSQHGVTLS